MKTLSLFAVAVLVGCSTPPTSPLHSGARSSDVIAAPIPNPVLLSVEQVGSDLKVTWTSYPQPVGVSTIWGTVHGFYKQGSKTYSAVAQFVYANTLAAGEMTMPIDSTTKNGAVVSVTLWTSALEAPAVASNTLTFKYAGTHGK